MTKDEEPPKTLFGDWSDRDLEALANYADKNADQLLKSEVKRLKKKKRSKFKLEELSKYCYKKGWKMKRGNINEK